MQNQYTSYPQQLHNSVVEKLNQTMDSCLLLVLDLVLELQNCYVKITTVELHLSTTPMVVTIIQYIYQQPIDCEPFVLVSFLVYGMLFIWEKLNPCIICTANFKEILWGKSMHYTQANTVFNALV